MRLLFLFISDGIAILALPYGMCFLALDWLTRLLSCFRWSKHYDLFSLYGFTLLIVGFGLVYFGLESRPQRYTLALLTRYLWRAVGLVLGLQTGAVLLWAQVDRFYPTTPILGFRPGDVIPFIWIGTAVTFAWLGYYLLMVPDPLPLAEERLVRGLELEKGETIEERAFRDR